MFIFVLSLSLLTDDLTKSNLGSSSDSEKIIQRLNDELQEAQELANSEKRKCMELQGKTLWIRHFQTLKTKTKCISFMKIQSNTT